MAGLLGPTAFEMAPHTEVDRVVRRNVTAALNRVDTWLEHPTFDNKAQVLDNLLGVRYAAGVAEEIVSGSMILHSHSFDVDWLLFSDLIVSIKMSRPKATQRTALFRAREGMKRS